MKNQLKAIKVLIVYNESLICVIKVYVKTWIGRNDLSRLFRQFGVIIIKKINKYANMLSQKHFCFVMFGDFFH